MEKSQEEKRAEFLKKAHDNKVNFDLHRRLIEQHLEFSGDARMEKASIESYLNSGKVSGGLLLKLMCYAEQYHKETKI